MKMKIVGRGEDGTSVIDGGYLLYLKDTHGLPIETSIALLEERGLAFDVITYFKACHENPNYSLEKSLRMLKGTTTSTEIQARLERALVYYLEKLGDLS